MEALSRTISVSGCFDLGTGTHYTNFKKQSSEEKCQRSTVKKFLNGDQTPLTRVVTMSCRLIVRDSFRELRVWLNARVIILLSRIA